MRMLFHLTPVVERRQMEKQLIFLLVPTLLVISSCSISDEAISRSRADNDAAVLEVTRIGDFADSFLGYKATLTAPSGTIFTIIILLR